MGGANKQGASAPMATGQNQAMPEIRRATLPTAQDWKNEASAQQRDIDRANMAKFIMGASQDIGKQFGQMGSQRPSAQPLRQWQGVQRYSKDPNSTNLQFTPLSPLEVFDDNRSAVGMGIASGIQGLASGALSGLSFRMQGSGSGSGSNINYKG